MYPPEQNRLFDEMNAALRRYECGFGTYAAYSAAMDAWLECAFRLARGVTNLLADIYGGASGPGRENQQMTTSEKDI